MSTRYFSYTGLFKKFNNLLGDSQKKEDYKKFLNDLGILINTYSGKLQNTPKRDVSLGIGFEDYFQFIHETSVDKRRKNYQLYKKMEETDPIIAAALNIYADEITLGEFESDIKRTYQIITPDPTVKQALELINTRVKLKEQIKQIAYSLVQMGECFHEIVYPVSDNKAESHYPKKLFPLPVETIELNIGLNGEFENKDSAFYQIIDTDRGNPIEFPWWKIIHWKWTVRPDQYYGQSLLYPVRKLYHAIHACVDGIVIERMLRAHQRLKIKVDTGNLAVQEAWETVRSMQQQYQKKQIIDSQGRLHLNNIPRTPEEDIWIPTGPEGKSDVDILRGTEQTQHINDVMFLINYYISALHIPKAYLAFEGETHNRNVISQLDIHHARQVRAYQGALIEGLHNFYNIVLAGIGIDPSTVDYKIIFPMIRTEDDMRKWEIMNLKTRLAFMLRTQIGVQIRDEWIMVNLLEVSPEELEVIGFNPDNVNPPVTYGGVEQTEQIVNEIKRIMSNLDSTDPEIKKHAEQFVRHLYEYAELTDNLIKHKTNGKYKLSDFQHPKNGEPSFAIHPDNGIKELRNPELNRMLFGD